MLPLTSHGIPPLTRDHLPPSRQSGRQTGARRRGLGHALRDRFRHGLVSPAPPYIYICFKSNTMQWYRSLSSSLNERIFKAQMLCWKTNLK